MSNYEPASMHVLLCNERFLFRFGVDRALMILGQGLRDRGYRVSVMANRMDTAVVRTFADRIIEIPEGASSYLDLNEYVAEWLKKQWCFLFEKDSYPQTVLVGGWPFFSSIPVFEQLGCTTIFMDCGAVPLEDPDDVVQKKLRELRKNNLQHLSLITPISEFIARTQSRPEAGSARVERVYLGADHMHLPLWVDENLNKPAVKVRSQLLPGSEPGLEKKIRVLNLGRWEPNCYKNSTAIYELLRLVRASLSDIAVYILADALTTVVPDEYVDVVIPIGFPSDTDLQRIMAEVDVGVTVSQWEGFNLPLAEMQWLNKPALAFDLAAHPEVVAHPWFLCQNIEEMAVKLINLVQGGGVGVDELESAYTRFRNQFSWRAAIEKYDQLIRKAPMQEIMQRTPILIDVTNATRDPANSGVIRVCRRLCRELQAHANPQFVVWSSEQARYVYPIEAEYVQLAQFNGPIINANMPRSRDWSDRMPVEQVGPGWLILAETILELHGEKIRRFARAKGLRTAAIFYDAIPFLRPDLCKDVVIRDNHAAYMKGLAACDLVLAISQFSAGSIVSYWRAEGMRQPPIIPLLLPGEFGGAERSVSSVDSSESCINILCVSTLEPRKNHINLIKAVKILGDEFPHLKWKLTLIGNRYQGSDDICEYVQQACMSDKRIQWMGIVDDDVLHRAYSECSFTVYASEIEGFGMPILESIWHGKPCICHQYGVMAELAAAGGCLTSDVTNPAVLANAIGRLALDVPLRNKLTDEALNRPLRVWKDYAQEFCQNLIDAPCAEVSELTFKDDFSLRSRPPVMSWQEILYPDCLTQQWQMNDSERLGMTAVLHRLQPTCAIEIGTYKGGSLSLISQYAKSVFSIDIDPSIPEKFKQFSNVSFLTGPSQLIMPALLKELDDAGMPVEFVLIDGDHSAAGVQRDIDIMLDYIPKKPLVVMMHDGFNPECRKGMIAASWGKSKYVHWVDLDFIPGRLIEHGGGGDGEMWGGLAMVCMLPHPRQGDLKVNTSSNRVFTELKSRHYG